MPSQRFAALRRFSEFFGCWVALEECVFEDRSPNPVDGAVVDHDFDLARLCKRLKERGVSHSAVVRVCDGSRTSDSRIPSSSRRTG